MVLSALIAMSVLFIWAIIIMGRLVQKHGRIARRLSEQDLRIIMLNNQLQETSRIMKDILDEGNKIMEILK